MSYYDADNPDYKKCCIIAEYLEEVDCRSLSQLVINIVANYPETRENIPYSAFATFE